MAYLVFVKTSDGSSIPRTDEDDFQALRILILTFSPQKVCSFSAPSPNNLIECWMYFMTIFYAYA